VGDREINMCVMTSPEARGLLVNDGENRWRFIAFYNPADGERSEDFTPERCVQVVRAVVGAPDLTVNLYGIAPWNDAVQVAERFYDRRVFLAGDATHQMSPAGGFGMNTGIQQAHNLAWKLAAVLGGWAPPELLATYEAERAPISRVMTEQMARNMSSLRGTNGAGANSAPPRPGTQPTLGRPESLREHGLVFGATYDSALIAPDGSAPVQVANPVSDYVPNARPGSRAPHAWLERAGERISTLDLFGRGFVLLAGARGGSWCEAAAESVRASGVPLQAYRVGRGGDWTDPAQTWATLYGVDEDGAVLVRPDGYVAWRRAAAPAEPAAEIGMALSTALARQPVPLRDGLR
jgi:hypothetical protein